MAWLEVSLDTTHEGVDWVKTLLAKSSGVTDLSIASYSEIEQEKEGDRSETHSPWAFRIMFYLPYDASCHQRAEDIENSLSSLQRTHLITVPQLTIVEEKPIQHQRDSAPIYHVGQRFVVLPPDTPYSPKSNEITLTLERSFAFGSGLHPATINSLHLLNRYVSPGLNALDLGSGTGILSIAMAKLGATVLALDNDSSAVQATQNAVDLNGVSDRVTVIKGSLGQGSALGHWMGLETTTNLATIKPTAAFDLIVANILARVHVALAHDFHQAIRRTMSHTGIVITGGFTTDYEDEVNHALTEAGFAAIDRQQTDEWVVLAHQLQ